MSMRMNQDAHATTVATMLASQKMEQLRALAWTWDALGLPISELTTDTTVVPPSSSGGTGLSASPPGTLGTNTPGYCDFLDENGAHTRRRQGAARRDGVRAAMVDRARAAGARRHVGDSDLGEPHRESAPRGIYRHRIRRGPVVGNQNEKIAWQIDRLRQRENTSVETWRSGFGGPSAVRLMPDTPHANSACPRFGDAFQQRCRSVNHRSIARDERRPWCDGGHAHDGQRSAATVCRRRRTRGHAAADPCRERCAVQRSRDGRSGRISGRSLRAARFLLRLRHAVPAGCDRRRSARHVQVEHHHARLSVTGCRAASHHPATVAGAVRIGAVERRRGVSAGRSGLWVFGRNGRDGLRRDGVVRHVPNHQRRGRDAAAAAHDGRYLAIVCDRREDRRGGESHLLPQGGRRHRHLSADALRRRRLRCPRRRPRRRTHLRIPRRPASAGAAEAGNRTVGPVDDLWTASAAARRAVDRAIQPARTARFSSMRPARVTFRA